MDIPKDLHGLLCLPALPHARSLLYRCSRRAGHFKDLHGPLCLPAIPDALVTVVQVSTRSVERCGVGDHIGMESMSLHLMESCKAFSVKLEFRMC